MNESPDAPAAETTTPVTPAASVTRGVAVLPDAAIGATALLRIAGMPCADWTAAAGTPLFERVARHADDTRERGARARALAERLGREVVPCPGLADADRGTVLALRRRLHAGAAPEAVDCRSLDDSPAVPRDVAEEARALLRAAGAAAAEERELERAVTAELERVAARGWEVARSRPVMRAFLAAAAPGLAEDVERRLADGQSWSGKQLRKRSAYLWRALGRAAAKTTPRGWAGQLAAIPVSEGYAVPEESGGAGGAGVGAGGLGRAGSLLVPSPPGAPYAVLGALAAGATENVHLVRVRTAPEDLRTADPATLLVPAPLHFAEPPAADGRGRLRCWVVEPREPGRLRHVVLRRSHALDRVLGMFADGPCALGELERTLLGARPDGAPPDPDILRGFLQHLVSLGVLQVCAAPRLRYSTWTPAGEAGRGALPWPVAAGDGDPAGWFLDSYRDAHATVSAEAAERVLRGLRVAARVAALRDADGPGPGPLPELAAITEEPRPVSDILAARLTATDGAPPPAVVRRGYAGWHPADTAAGTRGAEDAEDAGTSGYARLLAHLGGRPGEVSVDVDDALLDALGAPSAVEALPHWPMDCLLRPLPDPAAGPVAVLETASAAGVLDARFAGGLRALYGSHGNADAYRAFLAALERRTGVLFVELLLPPLAERAANAVRRPVVTGWWTGDPDPTPYYGPVGAAARYLPLDRITVRRSGRRYVAEADGRRVIPVHHATRSPAPPYDLLARVLLCAGHPAASRVVRLDGLDAALPDRTRLPRVTVGGDLVVSPATWRLDRSALWRTADSALGKVRTLALLRRSAGLPRHGFVRTAAGAKPVPVDFDSVTAIPLIERLCAQQAGGELLVEEMLPAPGALVLRDPLHGGAAVAAQALLRLPCRTDPEALAESAADALLRGSAHHVPGPRAAGARPAGAALAHSHTERKRSCPQAWN
ncbi:lantibiotic dehydratase [Streptomyces sp. NPDC047928]|uniref:lantibiotic dehydratase n=1 Tax=unclassified Streptomyces TaxID=2593676 RepID=UPI0037207154